MIALEPWGTGDLPLLERLPAADSRQFKIVVATTGEGVGWVGYWEREWRGSPVFEIGWSVLPTFPAVASAPSNAICRKLGFTLLEQRDFEYPPGNTLRCNDWRLDLA